VGPRRPVRDGGRWHVGIRTLTLAFRRINAKYETAVTLTNLGAKLDIEGNLQGAQEKYREALSLFGAIGDKAGLATTITNLGEVLFARGELKQAQDMHQESLATNREIGDKAGQGYDPTA